MPHLDEPTLVNLADLLRNSQRLKDEAAHLLVESRALDELIEQTLHASVEASHQQATAVAR